MAEALKDGTVNETAITRAAGRVLYEIVQFGYLDGQSKHDVTAQSFIENAEIIEKTGEAAAVLLKNEGVLPLKAADLDSVVLIGPTAGQVDSIGINGERSVGVTQLQVGPLAALKEISGNSKIKFAVADDMTAHQFQLPRSATTASRVWFVPARAPRRPTHSSISRAATLWLPTLPSPGRARSPRPMPAPIGSISRRWNQCKNLHRRQAAGPNRRRSGRRAWRHSASQSGQCYPHHRWPRQRAPRG